MQAIETTLAELFRQNTALKELCQQFGWGKIEIAVKDGKPVLISVKRDFKLS